MEKCDCPCHNNFAGTFSIIGCEHCASIVSIKTTCPHNGQKHTEKRSEIKVIYTYKMITEEIIITYCADCGEKLKEVIIK